MYRRMFFFMMLASIGISGCAKKIPLSYEQMELGNFLYVTQTNGETVKGELKEKNEHQFSILPEDNPRTRIIERNNILDLRKKESVYDESGRVIAESEIKKNQNGTNKWLFWVGGSALSFGISFFVTANVLHNSASEVQGFTLWGPTTAGALLGGTLFGIQGHKIDRHHAIEAVKDQRKLQAIKEFNSTKQKRSSVEHEIKSLKNQREKQNEEINKLLKQINKKKDKEEPR